MYYWTLKITWMEINVVSRTRQKIVYNLILLLGAELRSQLSPLQ